MSAFIIFVCTALLIYWASRTLLLLKGREEQIDEVLEADLWLFYRILAGLRSMFFPPNLMAGF